jgi:hypothetical protein
METTILLLIVLAVLLLTEVRRRNRHNKLMRLLSDFATMVGDAMIDKEHND